jgi:hypothetical protein
MHKQETKISWFSAYIWKHPRWRHFATTSHVRNARPFDWARRNSACDCKKKMTI